LINLYHLLKKLRLTGRCASTLCAHDSRVVAKRQTPDFIAQNCGILSA